MEYQFTNTVYGVMAKCSMEHEAFAHWLNSEIAPNPQLLKELVAQMQRCKQRPHDLEVVMEGREYGLYLTGDEVMVKANNFAEGTSDEMEDGFQFYNQESIAFCGFEDFERFINAYQQFLQNYH